MVNKFKKFRFFDYLVAMETIIFLINALKYTFINPITFSAIKN